MKEENENHRFWMQGFIFVYGIFLGVLSLGFLTFGFVDPEATSFFSHIPETWPIFAALAGMGLLMSVFVCLLFYALDVK